MSYLSVQLPWQIQHRATPSHRSGAWVLMEIFNVSCHKTWQYLKSTFFTAFCLSQTLCIILPPLVITCPLCLDVAIATTGSCHGGLFSECGFSGGICQVEEITQSVLIKCYSFHHIDADAVRLRIMFVRLQTVFSCRFGFFSVNHKYINPIHAHVHLYVKPSLFMNSRTL